MSAPTEIGISKSEKEADPEIRLKASAVSRGVAVGQVVCLYGHNRQFFKISLGRSEMGAEIDRLDRAVAAATRQLTAIAKRRAGKFTESGPGIFEAHKQIIEDSSLISKFKNEIAEQLVNAEWAVKHVTEMYVAQYQELEDEHLRDRHIDIEDVSERILTALGGYAAAKYHLAPDSIIAAKELRPSTLIELADEIPRAVITENGGWTSHTFILAREMGWPAVTGLKNIFRRIKTGDQVLIDGFNGMVIVNPTKDTLSQFASATGPSTRPSTELPSSDTPSKTLDGKEVRIYANADSPSTYSRARHAGAVGIGLYRSEFLFDRYRGFPTEAEQFKAYCEIGDAVGEAGVKIRTFDLGAERLLDQNGSREKNPALGLRAIRLGLSFRKLLRTQIRALIRASAGRAIDIVVPMVSGIAELHSVREMMNHETDLLISKGKEVGTPRLGAMIEVPSAVLMIKEIVDMTDFVCLGTNDLIQYLLAVDRDNEAVADWYRTLHPAVLRAIQQVIDASNAAAKPAILCGEMAGSPYYVPVLIGLGATDLSMNINSIAKVRWIVSGIAADETRVLYNSVKVLNTAEEVEDTVSRTIRTNWVHLFPPDFSFN